jgi:hypothetical protein
MWQCVINFLETQAPVISLATIILMAVYVLYTIRTFKSIHRQTELLSEAYLLVSYHILQEGLGPPSVSPGSSGTSGYSGTVGMIYANIYTTAASSFDFKRGYERIEEKMVELHRKWRAILSKNIPDAVQPEKDITLYLQNRGKSDIVWWKINLKAHIEPGKYLASKFNINGENCEWSIEYKGSHEVIASMDGINISIGKSGVFPELTLSWTIEYKDMRDVSYAKFGGDRSLTDRNVLADPLTNPAA